MRGASGHRGRAAGPTAPTSAAERAITPRPKTGERFAGAARTRNPPIAQAACVEVATLSFCFGLFLLLLFFFFKPFA